MFENVTVARKAVFSHDGQVSTRTLLTAQGEMKSLGVMQPGTYRFMSEGPETLEVTQGRCRVKLAQDQAWTDLEAGERFQVPASAHYEVEVDDVLDFVRHFDAMG